MNDIIDSNEKDQTETMPAEFNFMDLTEIPVPVQFDFGEVKIKVTFYCRLMMSGEQKEARQAFFAQTAEEQAAGRHAYNVGLLSALTEKQPDGLPSEFYDLKWLKDNPTKLQIRTAVFEYFKDAERQMNVLIASEAINAYAALTSNQALLFRT